MASQDGKASLIRPALLPGVLGALVLLGAGTVEPEWFSLVRYAASILALVIAVFAFQAHKWWWAIPMLAVAVVWNPVWPIDFAPEARVLAQFFSMAAFIVVAVLLRTEIPDGARSSRAP